MRNFNLKFDLEKGILIIPNTRGKLKVELRQKGTS
jgi:hypothetical protein